MTTPQWITDRAPQAADLWAFGAIAGGAVGFWIGRWWPRFTRYNRMQDPDWRRSFSHENINRPSGPPPLKFRRSGEGGPGPSTWEANK